jgi:hypothetical protein
VEHDNDMENGSKIDAEAVLRQAQDPDQRESRPYDLSQHWPIEFLLFGKTEWYPGSALGKNAQNAIKTFLENYSPSMGKIIAIRVPIVHMDRIRLTRMRLDSPGPRV